jgi:YHS domain-containing protein
MISGHRIIKRKNSVMKRDPICNMAVEEHKAYTEEYNGGVYFFCSSGCRERFLNERLCKLPRTTYDLIIIGVSHCQGPGGTGY